jgi:LPXTG-site transpeptidase (sortase) family protein
MANTGSRPPRAARAAGWFSTLLIVIGVFILLAAIGLQVYSFLAERRFEADQKALMTQFLPAPAGAASAASATATATFTPTPMPALLPTVTATAASVTAPAPAAQANAPLPTMAPTPPPTATLQPTATATATATPRPTPPSDPGRLIIPKLNLDTPIVLVKLANGEWNINKLVYEVGLLGSTGFPGWPGNAVITGHVSLIRYGNGPLRWLEKLAAGDDVFVQQGDHLYNYKVVSSRTVLPTDVSVVAPSEDTRITLITCTAWDYLKSDYTRRLVVTAVLDTQHASNGVAQ